MTRKVFSTGFGQRLPGRVRPGSHAYFRRNATLSARAAMQEIIARYNQLIRNMDASTPEILANALQPAFDLSQLYVPVKTGLLQRSGVLAVEEDTATGQTEASITYGDAEAWYAALVHEFTWLNHEYPTRAKYLQEALEESVDDFIVSAAVDYATLMS